MKSTLLMLALPILTIPALADTTIAKTPPPMEARQAELEKGRIAYEICRGCHKADGSGRAEAVYPSLAAQHASVLAKQMHDVRSGRRLNPKMHPFIDVEAIPDDDIGPVAAYLASLPPIVDNGRGDGTHLEHGQALYEKDCAECHGRQGEGDAQRVMPRLASQHYSYLLRESRLIRTSSDNRRDADPEMVKRLSRYSDSDLAAVSDYLSRLATRP